MVVSINMTDEEIKLAKAYAKLIGLPLNKAIKRTYFEKIEDEYDIALTNKALKEYQKNPKIYTHDEIKKMFVL